MLGVKAKGAENERNKRFRKKAQAELKAVLGTTELYSPFRRKWRLPFERRALTLKPSAIAFILSRLNF